LEELVANLVALVAAFLVAAAIGDAMVV